MVLTRWSANTGALVTPVNATVFSGSTQVPVATGELDFLVYQLIDADLGAILVLRPNRSFLSVRWQVIMSLTVQNASSISAFGGNPIRRKLGSVTYAQGLYAQNLQQINYPFCLLEQQVFIFAEGLPEPSLSVVSLPPVPEARQWLIAPGIFSFSSPSQAEGSIGATRALFSLNPGIIGIAEVSYVATVVTSDFIPLTDSILVSQL